MNLDQVKKVHIMQCYTFLVKSIATRQQNSKILSDCYANITLHANIMFTVRTTDWSPMERAEGV